MRKLTVLSVLCLGLTTIAVADGQRMSIQGFHIGMTQTECDNLTSKYSWSGKDPRKEYRPNQVAGAPPFTLAGVVLIDAPTCTNSPVNQIVFVIPEADLGPILEVMIRKYANARDCGDFDGDGGRIYQCVVDGDQVEMRLGQIKIKDAGQSNWHTEHQLTITSFGFAKAMTTSAAASRYNRRSPVKDF